MKSKLNKGLSLVYFFVLLCLHLLISFSNTLLSQEIQMIPIMPQIPPPQSLPKYGDLAVNQKVSLVPGDNKCIGNQYITQIPSPQIIPQMIPRQILEKPSEFEQFVSKVLELKDTEFEIIKRLEGISFSYTPSNLPELISIPVRILSLSEKGQKVEYILTNAGYLIGAPENLSKAFQLLGIPNYYFPLSEVRLFGADIFNMSPSTFAPATNIPVPPDYVIGPRDELKISVWGMIEGQWDVVVERDGTIMLPRIGTIRVAGLTYEKLKEVLYEEFSKYYRNFSLNVSLGALRSITIYVVGYAKNPGSYTVSSLSTLVNALFVTGGPSKSGSLRDIQLKRNGKTIVHFDLYEFLIKGDKSKDVRLKPEDVIYIPPVGPLVAITGSVKRPAIYELKNEKTLKALIDLAGGLTDIAFTKRVQIERVISGEKQIVFDDYLSERLELPLQNGDIVKIFPVPSEKKYIYIFGAVHKPGEYGFKESLTLTKLIELAGGVKDHAYLENVEITRIIYTQSGQEIKRINVNLKKILDGVQEDFVLRHNDYVFIRSIPEWKSLMTVTISGEVKFPGTYTIKKGERLSSLLERAGGYTDKAYLRGTIFIRKSVKELQQKGLEAMIARLEQELFAEETTKVLTALSSEEIQARKASLENRRRFIESLKQLKATGRMVIRLAHLRLLKGSEYDIELEDGDFLYIPTKNNVVNVVGAVMSPGSLVYSEKLTYKDYIQMCGGLSNYADPENIYVIKVDGSARKLSRSLISWNPFKSRWELSIFGEEEKEIEPGDTIVVPTKLEKIAWLREFKDITQILMQMAVTAGVVLNLF